MKVIIFGANGQLGNELFQVLKKNYLVYGFSKEDCDICNKRELKKIFHNLKPDIVINAAAYTNVDEAENNFSLANKINNLALKYISELVNDFDAILIHFSTDYVFNETNKIPIVESCKKNPINKYGLSKHLGEEQILNKCKKYFIFRISWVYGKYGQNFPKKIIALAKQEKVIRVINDQEGIPTSTKFIAQTINKIISKKEYLTFFGVYNIAPLGSVTWYGLAVHIKSIIDSKNLPICALKDIIPVKSEEYITNASRPRYSCLNNIKMCDMFNIRTYDWTKYLDEYMDEIL